MNAHKEIFVCYVGNFKQLQRQYFAVARFRFTSEEDVNTFEDKVSSTSKSIVLRSSQKKILHKVLYNDTGSLEEEFDFYEGLPTGSSEPFMLKRKMKVVDVPRYDHFDKADDQYPECATYILYGDEGNAYLFHSPTKDPDYLQVKLFGTKLKSLTSFFCCYEQLAIVDNCLDFIYLPDSQLS